MRRPPTAKELRRLYHEIGEGIWHLQYVKDALSKLLTLKLIYKLQVMSLMKLPYNRLRSIARKLSEAAYDWLARTRCLRSISSTGFLILLKNGIG